MLFRMLVGPMDVKVPCRVRIIKSLATTAELLQLQGDFLVHCCEALQQAGFQLSLQEKSVLNDMSKCHAVGHLKELVFTVENDSAQQKAKTVMRLDFATLCASNKKVALPYVGLLMVVGLLGAYQAPGMALITLGFTSLCSCMPRSCTPFVCCALRSLLIS